MTKIEHPELGSILLVSSPRLRRITLTVRRDGVVRLSYPTQVGRERALAFLAEKKAWVVRAQARAAERAALMPPAADKDEVEALRAAAKADLPLRVARLAEQTQLRYAGLTIRAARTRWGSCSGKNQISLSLYLMRLPEHLRDFIILHELCHTIHHNHSPRFHALLDGLLGGREAALRRELRSYRIG